MKASVEKIELEGKSFLGIRVELPEAPLLLITAPKGYLMCGYLNLETADKLKQAAVVVRGVKNLEEMLNAEIVEVSQKCAELGVKPGCRGREALLTMS